VQQQWSKAVRRPRRTSAGGTSITIRRRRGSDHPASRHLGGGDSRTQAPLANPQTRASSWRLWYRSTKGTTRQAPLAALTTAAFTWGGVEEDEEVVFAVSGQVGDPHRPCGVGPDVEFECAPLFRAAAHEPPGEGGTTFRDNRRGGQRPDRRGGSPGVTGEHGGPGCPGVGGGQRGRSRRCCDRRGKLRRLPGRRERRVKRRRRSHRQAASSETATTATIPRRRNHPPAGPEPLTPPRRSDPRRVGTIAVGAAFEARGADPRCEQNWSTTISDARDPVPGWPAIRCRAVGPDCSEEFVATDALKAAVGCVAVPGARGLNPGRTHHAVVATRTDRVERHDSGANRGEDPTRHTVGRTAAALLPLGGVPSEVTSSRKVR
jgi:hypothetical protein